jgi:muconolactone delta-isomerase
MDDASSVRATDTRIEERLVYQGEVLINFRTSRQWVSIKLFAVAADTDDHDVLASLICHLRYRDSYAAAEFKDAETIHGPYWLRAITPDVFSVVSATDAEALIRTWADYTVPLTDEDRAAMEREVYPRIADATSRYLLPDLRDTAQHDWGASVGADGFYEFVLIDRHTNVVALVVASDD